MPDKRQMPAPGEIWRNWKTGDVVVAGLSRDSDTTRTRVLYRHLNVAGGIDKDSRPWDRPFLEWEQEIERPAEGDRPAYKGPRFVKVSGVRADDLPDSEWEIAGLRICINEMLQAARTLWLTIREDVRSDEIGERCAAAWKDLQTLALGAASGVLGQALVEAMTSLRRERDDALDRLKADQEGLARGALDAQAAAEAKMLAAIKERDKLRAELDELRRPPDWEIF